MKWDNPEVPLDANLKRVVVRFAWLPTNVQGGAVWLEQYRQHQWMDDSGIWWNGRWEGAKCLTGALAREVYS